MRPVKRIEIVIDSLELRKLLKNLEQVGVSGYTVIQDAAGMGDRGGAQAINCPTCSRTAT